MKCIYCGNELKEGSLFCPYCGKEVQIVPDYNIYDDDYLKAVLAQENADTDAFADVNGTKAVNKASSENGKKKPKNSKKQKIIIASVIGVIAVLVIVLILVGMSIRKSHDNSFDYQVEMAEKAYDSGDIDEAIAYYEKALALDKDNIEVRLTLA